MRRERRLSWQLIVLVLAAAMIACGRNEPPTPQPTPTIATRTPPRGGTPSPMVETGFAVRLTYQHMLCSAGAPTLLVYADGTVLSPGVVGCSLAGQQVTKYDIGAEGVAEILSHLDQLGFFDLVSWGTADNDTDSPNVILEADDGRRAVMVTGWRSEDPMMVVVKYLASVVEGLSGGVPYEPEQVLLNVTRVTEENRSPGYFPKPWALEGIIDLAGAERETRLPAATARPFTETAKPWRLYLVKVAPRELYWVWWRPLFPHEVE